MIHSFQAVQVNDSGDLFIFLLEALNSELSKLHNKRRNITKSGNEHNQMINVSNEKQVLSEFLK